MTGKYEAKGLIDSLSGVLRSAMDSSTSLLVLVFSGILVVLWIWRGGAMESKVGFVIFYTFLYALTNHYLSVFSKVEGIRAYSRASLNFWLFGVVFWLLFSVWVVGTINIFLNKDSASPKDFLGDYVLNSLFYFNILKALLLFFLIWLFTTFCCWARSKGVSEEDERTKGTAYYEIEAVCRNCAQFLGLVEIPRGLKVESFSCPRCGVTALTRR